ncbi:iron-sulfur cluster assembly accessory protein [Bradyrhizobium valentinum]|uniref:iron-sulfur cluster assembly accessory protein n=1 Tax=Bradyrhizobium valentinum TaxID=1518501 RepID=UPI001FD9D757|nr:iron-sulfur cluster assembly accessory protein [Bradyrhizobium valentinum]
MTITLTPAAEKLTSYVLRADGTFGAGFRLAVTADGCSGLSARRYRCCAGSSARSARRRAQRPKVASQCRVTIDLTDTSAQTGLIFPEAGMLLQQHRKGCPLEEESCQ